ncbi:MAG: autotransporter domain-containing protein, partial [Lysobacterales bacterium]
IAADAGTTQYMTRGRSSDHALVVRGGSSLTLFNRHNTFGPPVAGYRFSGGTTIEEGVLDVTSSASLQSDVLVQAAGSLLLGGNLIGNVTNHGNVFLNSRITGDVTNDGVLTPGSSMYSGYNITAHIDGNFTQTAAGTLAVVIPPDAAVGTLYGGLLTVTGRANIDGTLRLDRYLGYYHEIPLPSSPVSFQVLHADGGVSGEFAQWTSPGLFITGDLRYLEKDVYFDAESIAAAQAMAVARAGDALTLHSAANFDAALVNATRWARMPGELTATQRQFLASVGRIQRLQDFDQAVRTFDSLSGAGYAAAADSLLQQAAMPGLDLIARVGSRRFGSVPESWASRTALMASGTASFNGQRTGVDQWFGDHLLVGGSFGWNDGSLRFDRSGGHARDRSPQWDFYLRRNGKNGSYVFGDLGYGHHELSVDRRIDLGTRGQAAGTRHSLDVMSAYVEVGRDFRFGRTRLTPFGAMSYAVLNGAGFTEQGSTGFELIAQPSTYRRFNAAAGLRLGSDWRGSDGRWTRLNLTTGYRQLLHANDDAVAAFTGAPVATFALDGAPPQRTTGWTQVNLTTEGERWNWLLNYDRQGSDDAVSVAAQIRY